MSPTPFVEPIARTIPKLTLPIERHVLSCGAVLLVSQRKGAPVFSAHAHLRGGPATDPAGLEGCAYLVGALADQGTRSRTEEDIANALEPAGGDISGDASGLVGTIVNDDWELLLELLAEQLREPTFPAEQVGRQKKRLLDRLLVERDDPRHQVGLLFRRLVYGDHWLGRAAYGSIESVRRIEPRHLRAHHRRNWVARRGIVAVCGDIDAQRVRRVLERLLARWTPGTPLATTPPRFPDRGPRVGTFRADRQQVHVYLGHLGIRRADPDYAALVVLDHVLGTGPGFTNRISRRLRDELGLAYSVSASIHSSAGILPGMFTAYIGTSPKHLETAVKGFLHEIRKIQDELVTQAELDVAKSYLLGSYALGFERASRRTGYMASAEVHGFPADHLERLLESFAAVTLEDLRRVARQHLHPEASCLAAAGPISERELRAALGDGATRSRRGARARA